MSPKEQQDAQITGIKACIKADPNDLLACILASDECLDRLVEYARCTTPAVREMSARWLWETLDRTLNRVAFARLEEPKYLRRVHP